MNKKGILPIIQLLEGYSIDLLHMWFVCPLFILGAQKQPVRQYATIQIEGSYHTWHMTTIGMGLQQMVLASMYDPELTFAYICYRFEPVSKAVAPVGVKPCSLDHHGLASQVTLASLSWLVKKIHQTYSKQETMVMNPIVERFNHHQQNQIQDNYINCYCISNFQARLFFQCLSTYHPDVNTITKEVSKSKNYKVRALPV